MRRDIRKVAEPPRCGAMGTGTATYYFPKLLEDVLGLKLNVATGRPWLILNFWRGEKTRMGSNSGER
jgi:hypothetical protein